MNNSESQYSAGYYLKGLTGAIQTLLPAKLNKHFDCWMEDLEMHLTPKNNGLGRDIGYLSYKAVLSFERFPFKQFAPEIVLASVMAWLMDFDEHREGFELSDPTADVEPEDDNTAEMTIEVAFKEPLMVVEDEHGLIVWEGKRWTVAPYEVWVAEHCNVQIVNNHD
jgi:hypothetical protein